MNRRQPRARGCTYAVAVDADATQSEVVALASYLSTLSLADCEVLILDGSPAHQFDSNRHVLRWVGRHVAVDPRHRFADGEIDLLRAAVELASSEKVIVAVEGTRCTAADVVSICGLLDRHEVVEPEDYVAADGWWGGVEAGRILLHRGLEQPGQVRSTLAVRRSAYRPLLEFEERSGDAHLRRMIIHAAEQYGEHDVFIRREAPRREKWLQRRVREAAADFSLPLKTAFFLGLLPVVLLMAAVGGATTAAGYTGVLAFASVLLALKGRAGAARFFPVRACFFAPLWVAERSVSVYWALIQSMRAKRSVAAKWSAGDSPARAAASHWP
jgi:hypothetical protein